MTNLRNCQIFHISVIVTAVATKATRLQMVQAPPNAECFWILFLQSLFYLINQITSVEKYRLGAQNNLILMHLQQYLFQS